MLGLVSGSSENAKVVKDLLATLAERGVDSNEPRLWVIDGSKAFRSAIEQRRGDAARVRRCGCADGIALDSRGPPGGREIIRKLRGHA